ncbi:unnamed protein product [Brassica napus]|uniref:(rape) hypothetical protein n=1 Tax=Brassica napus TaxID=3708 RepID=A0A816KM10_BRANA|nr:unnamed protein product [Brassica napus]
MKKTQPNLKNNEDDPSSTDENQSSTHKRKRLSLDSPAITTSFKFQEPNVSRVLADVSNVTPTTPSLSSDQLFTIPESVFTPTNQNNGVQYINKLPIRSKNYRPYSGNTG